MRILFNGSYLSLPQTGIATYCRNLLYHWQHLSPGLVAYLPVDRGWEEFPGFRPVPRTNHLTRLLWNQGHGLRLSAYGDVVFHPVPEGGWTRARNVVTAHDVIPLRYPQFYPRKLAYFRHWVPLSLRCARHIAADSDQTKADLMEFYNLPPERITVIPLAYDRAHFRPEASHEPLVPYLLYVGSHEPHKNLTTLLSAFRTLSRQWPGELWIGGRFDPRYTPSLQAMVEGYRVRWLDYVAYAELPDLYRRATAFIFPSLYEGFGLPILEAMGCRTAVVAAHIPALREVGADAVHYFEAQSVADLTQALRAVIEDTAYRAHLQDRGLARAQEFDWARTAALTLSLCQTVAGS
ncbi:glycosyltransferase family 4 protein [Anthocerotibacter panamensis]|uniref:glycosyltransferase family 4 protein n=1 Tax=Anthocerotibacter panamensis TaxID=2857077 RepID=UPI001C4073CD|nr:glycosyltransferase family 1 protein [Anthocerotibacter panamensis]